MISLLGFTKPSSMSLNRASKGVRVSTVFVKLFM